MYGQQRTWSRYYLRILGLMYLTIFVKMHKKNIFIDFINGFIDHNYKSQILNPILVWAKARFLLFIF